LLIGLTATEEKSCESPWRKIIFKLDTGCLYTSSSEHRVDPWAMREQMGPHVDIGRDAMSAVWMRLFFQ
jgi:hypothetical protein